ncbi:MAG: outer membrane beta-barrel protein [Gammaproteobacteria bacterium]
MKTWRLVCLMAVLAPGVAWAAEGDLPYRTSGFYLGLGAGYSDLELKAQPVNVSGGDFGYKAFAGYRFPRAFLPWGINIALEAAWADLGEVTDDAPGARLALAVDGFVGSIVGYVPITHRFELFGKAGAYVWDAELAANGVTQDKDDGTDLALGVGIGYHTGGGLGFQAELEGYDLLDGALLASVSVTYQFK